MNDPTRNKFDIHKEAHFLQILEAIGDMVLVKGPKSKVLWANRAFCEYYGMTHEEVEGLIDAPFSEPDFTQKFIRDDALVFETGQPLDIPLEHVTRFDGVVRSFHTVKTPIFDKHGKVAMTVGISRDITDRLEADENLKAERGRSMYSAKMATLGEMAGGIAHEINTPLGIIVLLADQVMDVLKDPQIDVTNLKKNIDKIIQTTEKIAKIISGLRNFSRNAKFDQRVPTLVSEIIEDTLAFSREKMMSHGIRLSVYHQDQSMAIKCRAVEISQVLLNLLNNSQDAIIDHQSEKWIKIETRKVDQFVEISVTDSGTGIAPDVREKIFMPFFTTKEIGRGTGLGLSISSGIMLAHDGSIQLDTESAHTRFILRCPIVSPP